MSSTNLDNEKQVNNEERVPPSETDSDTVKVEADLVADKRLLRRLDLRILPIASLLYFSACALINPPVVLTTPIHC
jgi:hypothetical protein